MLPVKSFSTPPFFPVLNLNYSSPKIYCSKTLGCEHNSLQKNVCNPKHLYIKAFFLQGIKEKRGPFKCSNKLLNVVPSLNVTISLHSFYTQLWHDATLISRHRLYIKAKFIKTFCLSCKMFSNQVTLKPRLYCTLIWAKFKIRRIKKGSIVHMKSCISKVR